MNWKQQIFKPKWQHKDPAVRRDAVASESDPELLAALGKICLEDEAARVRSAAAKRLADLEVLSEALGRERDPQAARTISERMRQLAAAAGEDRAPLEARLRVVETSGDRELLEAVASAAPEPELRLAALRKTDRQGFLGDRAVADPEPGIRREAAAAITQRSTLRRVIDETRTTDKVLHQALQERLHQELLAAGDQQAVDREALDICTEVEHAALSPEPPGEADIEAFRERWTRLGGHVRPEHQQRFERDLARLAGVGASGTQATEETEPVAEPQSHPEGREEPAAAPGEAADTAPTTARPAAATQDMDRPASAILAEAAQVLRDYAGKPAGKLPAGRIKRLESNWNAAWATVSEPNRAELQLAEEAKSLLKQLHAKLEAAVARRDELLQKAGALVEELRNDLEEGELHKALEARLELQKLGKKLSGDSRWQKLSGQINSMQGRLRELRGWQHWSNNRIRKSMIREMEALPQADLHPDAVLERIKELQARWKELEQSEQIPGDKHFAAAPWMWRRFNAAGRAGFEATKPFLDKRSEIRKKHLEAMRALSGHIIELADSEAPDWPALTRAIRKGRQEMRSLGEVPAKARHRMAQRLKAALEKGNAALQAHYEVVENHKLKLIREAAQLTHVADRAAAISAAKSLQAEWKAAGSLWRSRENQLWKEFRAPLDPLFADLKAEQQSVREQRDALLADQKALCTSLEGVLDLDDTELPEQHGRVQGLRDSWKDIRHPDRRLQQKFQKLLATYESRVREQERKSEKARRERWWTKAELLHQAEAAVAAGKLTKTLQARLQKAWPDVAAGAELERALDQRFDAAITNRELSADARADPDQVAEQARKHCICLEFLAGLPSPEEEKELRMQYQVDRLSESLSGDRRRMSATDEAKMLEAEWLALPCFAGPEYDAFRARARSAIDRIFEDN